MSYLIINGTDVSDLVKSLKVGYETLVADSSGVNANGDTVIDIINKKIRLQIVFRPMDSTEMSRLLTALEEYVVEVVYRDIKTNSNNTITCHISTPEPDYYFILGDKVFYKEMSLNLNQL